jgi:biopolymer transport protein ExbD
MPVCVVAVSGLASRAEEQEVPVVNLPAKVVAAIQAKFPGAKLVSALKATEDGETGYEVKLTVKSPDTQIVTRRRFRSRVQTIPGKEQQIEIGVNADGTVYEMEKTIDVNELPQPVRNVLAKDYATASVTKVEEVFRNDKLEYYEIKLTSEKKKFEIEVTADGKLLVEETEKAKKHPGLSKKE